MGLGVLAIEHLLFVLSPFFSATAVACSQAARLRLSRIGLDKVQTLATMSLTHRILASLPPRVPTRTPLVPPPSSPQPTRARAQQLVGLPASHMPLAARGEGVGRQVCWEPVRGWGWGCARPRGSFFRLRGLGPAAGVRSQGGRLRLGGAPAPPRGGERAAASKKRGGRWV